MTGIRVSNNNHLDTVLHLFKDAIVEHGLPSHVRGNHGTENVRVAAFMIEKRGEGCGSYIFGRWADIFQKVLYVDQVMQVRT